MNTVLYQFLNEPHRLKCKLMEIDQRVEELRESMLPRAICYDKDSVMSSPDDKMIKHIQRIEPLAKRRKLIEGEYEKAYREVSRALDKLTPKQAIVMRLKYIDRKSNSDIAGAYGVSRRRVRQICEESYEILLDIALTSTLKYDIL